MSPRTPKASDSRKSSTSGKQKRIRIRKPSSIGDEMRAFISRFRFQDNSLMSFSKSQRKEIQKFHTFVAKTPDGFCSVCLKVLYREEQRYRRIANKDILNCYAWKCDPIMGSGRHKNKYMVCLAHQTMAESNLPIYVYPGKFF